MEVEKFETLHAETEGCLVLVFVLSESTDRGVKPAALRASIGISQNLCGEALRERESEVVVQLPSELCKLKRVGFVSLCCCVVEVVNCNLYLV